MTMENVRTCDRKMYKRPIIKITDGKLEYGIWKKASGKKKMDESDLPDYFYPDIGAISGRPASRLCK